MLDTLKIIYHQGKQFIPDLEKAALPSIVPSRPDISDVSCASNCKLCKETCTTSAIEINPVRLDMGKCISCIECSRICPQNKISFSNQHRNASNEREKLIITEGNNDISMFSPELIRKEIHKYFGQSLKLRLVSAGSCNGCELELNASGNVNFDMGRYGIEFVASPRHADGLVVTGSLCENSKNALELTFAAIPRPKILILCGTCAISGGLFIDNPATMRDFIETNKPDLYIPGCPPHPLTIINGILQLIGKI